jgi:hypothetical protein
MSGWAGSWAEWRRELAAAAVLGAFFGLLGPFGTFLNGPLELRLPYWIGMSLAGLAYYGLGLRIAFHWGERLGQPVWFVLPLTIAVLAVPASAATAFIVVAIWPRVGLYMHPWDWYGQAVMLALPLSVAAVWSRSVFPLHPTAVPALSTSPVADDAVPSAANFFHRLPPKLGSELLCLQMEDHYVRAHTARGSDLVLIPLKIAIAELDGVEGMQVHRSWWVARAAVDRPVQDGRNLRLRLTNGVEVPVSRSSVAVLRANRWLDSLSSP